MTQRLLSFERIVPIFAIIVFFDGLEQFLLSKMLLINLLFLSATQVIFFCHLVDEILKKLVKLSPPVFIFTSMLFKQILL